MTVVLIGKNNRIHSAPRSIKYNTMFCRAFFKLHIFFLSSALRAQENRNHFVAYIKSKVKAYVMRYKFDKLICKVKLMRNWF